MPALHLVPDLDHDLTVSEAAASGNRLALLVAMRAIVARAVGHPDTPPRDLAALTRRLMDIAREIEAIESGEEGGPTDDAPDEEWDPEAI